MRGRKPFDLEFLQSGPKIKAERVKVLVAFGDITDFGVWTRRGSNSPEEFKDFMVHLYKEFIRFRNGNGYFVKLMGDGFRIRDSSDHKKHIPRAWIISIPDRCWSCLENGGQPPRRKYNSNRLFGICD